MPRRVEPYFLSFRRASSRPSSARWYGKTMVALGDLEVLRRDRHAGLLQGLDLAPKALEVNDDTVAEDVHDARQADAGGDEVQGKFAVFIDDGMTGVVAALIPADDIIISRDEVDHAALAFVAPVDAYDCTVAHSFLLLIFPQFGLIFSFRADYMRFFPKCKSLFVYVRNKLRLYGGLALSILLIDLCPL